jgi:hypothetical protein
VSVQAKNRPNSTTSGTLSTEKPAKPDMNAGGSPFDGGIDQNTTISGKIIIDGSGTG